MTKEREYLFYVTGSWTISVKASNKNQAISRARSLLSSDEKTRRWFFEQDGHNNHTLTGAYQTASPNAFTFSQVIRHI